MSIKHPLNEILEIISNHLNSDLELVDCMYHSKPSISATIKVNQPVDGLTHQELSTLLKTASSKISEDLSKRYLRDFYVEINYFGVIPMVYCYKITIM